MDGSEAHDLTGLDTLLGELGRGTTRLPSGPTGARTVCDRSAMAPPLTEWVGSVVREEGSSSSTLAGQGHEPKMVMAPLAAPASSPLTLAPDMGQDRH